MAKMTTGRPFSIYSGFKRDLEGARVDKDGNFHVPLASLVGHLESDPPKVSIGKIMRPPAAQLGAKSK